MVVLYRFIVVLLFAMAATTDALAQKDAGMADVLDALPADAGAVVVDAAPPAEVVEQDGGLAPDAPDAGNANVERVDRDGGVGIGAIIVPGDPRDLEWDADGDGTLDPHELELQQKAPEVFADVPAEVLPETLDSRPRHDQLGVRSLTVARFRAMVQLTRKKVLARISARIQEDSAARMITVSRWIVVCSLSGVLLLLTPLFLARRYPNRLGVLFRYSALAAVTFMLTVSLLGAVSLIQRGALAALAEHTNPQLAMATGFFDTLDDDAEEYVVVGNELFAPTLVQLQGSTGEQPAVVLLANGRKLERDTAVFVRVAKELRRVAYVVGMLPTLLLVLSLVLSLVAIKPTLMSIVMSPAEAAASADASDGQVFRRSMRQVGNELLATVASLGVLVVITVLAGIALGRVVHPALGSLISYFTVAVMYLRFVEDASSALVLITLFSVILFIVLNLAVIVVATTFFIAKSRDIFQQRFTDKVPLTVHKKFWMWGSISVLWAMLFPLIYIVLARAGVKLINAQFLATARDAATVNWKSLMLVGPLLLVVGFVVALWASRAFAAIRFLMRYDAKGGSAHAALSVAETAASLARS